MFSFNLVPRYFFEVTLPTKGISNFEQTIRQKVCTDLRYIAIFATQGAQPGITALCTGTSTKEKNRQILKVKKTSVVNLILLCKYFRVHSLCMCRRQSISEEINDLKCQ